MGDDGVPLDVPVLVLGGSLAWLDEKRHRQLSDRQLSGWGRVMGAVMIGLYYRALSFVMLVIFPALIILHGIYFWGRGECLMMALSQWLGGE